MNESTDERALPPLVNSPARNEEADAGAEIRVRLAELERRCEQAERARQIAEAALARSRTEAQRLEVVLQKARTQADLAAALARRACAERDAVLASTSWRVTAPLRKIKTAGVTLLRDRKLFLELVRKNLSAFRKPVSPVPESRAEADTVLSTRKFQLVDRLRREIARRESLAAFADQQGVGPV